MKRSKQPSYLLFLNFTFLAILDRYLMGFADGALLKTCEAETLMGCLKEADTILQNVQLAFPADETSLSSVCRIWMEMTECIHGYTTKCLTDKETKEFHKYFQEPMTTMIVMCTDKTLSARQFRHSNCIRTVSMDAALCEMQYEALVTEISGVAENAVRNMCCALQDFKDCLRQVEAEKVCALEPLEGAETHDEMIDALNKSLLVFVMHSCLQESHKPQRCRSKTPNQDTQSSYDYAPSANQDQVSVNLTAMYLEMMEKLAEQKPLLVPVDHKVLKNKVNLTVIGEIGSKSSKNWQHRDQHEKHLHTNDNATNDLQFAVRDQLLERQDSKPGTVRATSVFQIPTSDNSTYESERGGHIRRPQSAESINDDKHKSQPSWDLQESTKQPSPQDAAHPFDESQNLHSVPGKSSNRTFDPQQSATSGDESDGPGARTVRPWTIIIEPDTTNSLKEKLEPSEVSNETLKPLENNRGRVGAARALDLKPESPTSGRNSTMEGGNEAFGSASPNELEVENVNDVSESGMNTVGTTTISSTEATTTQPLIEYGSYGPSSVSRTANRNLKDDGSKTTPPTMSTTVNPLVERNQMLGLPWMITTTWTPKSKKKGKPREYIGNDVDLNETSVNNMADGPVGSTQSSRVPFRVFMIWLSTFFV